jgi:hypothetical protein
MWITDCAQLELYTKTFGGYKFEEKLRLGVREQDRFNTTALKEHYKFSFRFCIPVM